jgi:glycosyltransferase involved in cell wall biosynthesis
MIQVAYVSTYVPKKCGLATYTHHLRQAVRRSEDSKISDRVVVVTESEQELTQETPDVWPLFRNQKENYAETARKINDSDVDVVSLQHEFGIFGGDAGSFILDFVRNLKKPLITTFHTVFEHPQPPYESIQREIAERSTKIVVMNRKAIAFLHQAFQIPKDKIVFIPHGAPAGNPDMRRIVRKQLGWQGRKVIMTFGLLSRGKGIELILHALPYIKQRVPDVLYAIVGQTHPEVKKREGETYRNELKEQFRSSGLENHVVMIDRYLDETDLVNHLLACDLYCTPYPGMQQITSGTLAYAVGLGRPVLSTPYCYAQDLLDGYEELLLPYADVKAWGEKIVSLFSNLGLLKEWEYNMQERGKSMHWLTVGEQHARLFAEVSNHALVLR